MNRTFAVTFLVVAALSLGACTPSESARQRHEEANTPAGKAGQAAHRVAVQLDKAAKAADRKLAKAAHDAREGWKEDAQKTRAKDTR